MDSYGVGHRKEVEKPKKRTKKELAETVKLEARSHANTCEELARASRFLGSDTASSAALDKAAMFIRRLAQ